MIISNLIGGLGNQMFQYSCGRALSLKSGLPLRLAIDQFKGYQQHNGLEILRVFNLSTPIATRNELISLLGFQALPVLRKLLGRQSMNWATTSDFYNEINFDYSPNIWGINRPTYIHGYWQSENYFKDIAHIIRDDLTFRADLDPIDQAVKKRMNASTSASLHIRRGDYLIGKSKKIYATCDISYYVAAVNILRDKFPEINLFAFSDDPEWVQKNLSPELGRFEIVTHNSGSRSANDMRLMSFADHNIIANSSFSWWGAWLNPHKDKVVIAPKAWFQDGRTTPSLIPSSWIQI